MRLEATTAPAQKWRVHLALLVIALGIGALIACAARGTPPVRVAGESRIPVVTLESEGFRYEFHVPTGTECLFDVNVDPRHRVNVISSNKDRARVQRVALEAKLGVQSLEDLRAPYADEIRRLEALGYL